MPAVENTEVVHTINSVLSDLLPGTVHADRTWDNEAIATADLNINTVGQVVVSQRAHKTVINSYFPPRLVTGFPPSRPQTQRQGFIALTKRNLLCVNHTDLTDYDDAIEKTWSNMMTVLMRPGARDAVKAMRAEPVSLTRQLFVRWIVKQPPTVIDKLNAEGIDIDDINIANLDYFLKKDAKPAVEDNAGTKIAAGQTIMFSRKQTNAIAGPLIEFFVDRLVDLLSVKVLYNRCKNINGLQEHFAQLLGERSDYYTVEDDISAYDKSQHAYCTNLVAYVTTELGFSNDFVTRYLRAQWDTKTTSINLGIQISRTYQRNSGMPDTAPFNTLVRLATVADSLAHVPAEKIISIAVLGDDLLAHLLRCPEVFDACDEHPGLLARLYNLTTKIFSNAIGYFCGFYLVHMNHKVYLVADPVRRTIKLGRMDMATEEQIQEYYVSFRDNLINYDNELVKDTVCRGVIERYPTNPVDVRALLDVMSHLRNNYKSFRSLWGSEIIQRLETQ